MNQSLDKTLNKLDLIRSILFLCSNANEDSRIFKGRLRLNQILFIVQNSLEFKNLEFIYKDSRVDFSDIDNLNEIHPDIERVLNDLLQNGELTKIDGETFLLSSNFKINLSEVQKIEKHNPTLKRLNWKIKHLGTLSDMELSKIYAI